MIETTRINLLPAQSVSSLWAATSYQALGYRCPNQRCQAAPGSECRKLGTAVIKRLGAKSGYKPSGRKYDRYMPIDGYHLPESHVSRRQLTSAFRNIMEQRRADNA